MVWSQNKQSQFAQFFRQAVNAERVQRIRQPKSANVITDPKAAAIIRAGENARKPTDFLPPPTGVAAAIILAGRKRRNEI
jgi:hypothetical protein